MKKTGKKTMSKGKCGLKAPEYAIQLWRGIDKQWYWHIISTVNGQILVTSEGYTTKRAAKKTIQQWVNSIVFYGIKYEEYDLCVCGIKP